MHSHKHLPKCLLKAFSYKKEILYNGRQNKTDVCDVYRCQSQEIVTEKIKKIGTEKNYYSDDVERYFSTHIEKPFADVKDKIRHVSDYLELTYDDFQAIKMFFLFSVLRTPKYINQLENTLVVAKSAIKTPIQENVLLAMDVAYKLLDRKFNISNRDLKIAKIDLANREFVLPQNVFYFYSNDRIANAIVFPVQRKWAIMLVEHEQSDNIPDLLHVKTDKQVDLFNGYAYLTERNVDNLFLVGSREELGKFKDKDYEYEEIYTLLKEGES